MKAIFMTNNGCKAVHNAFDIETRETLAHNLYFFPGIYNSETLEERKEDLLQVNYIFSTWGMFCLNEEKIREYLPNLKAVFYAAGSVQYFARPYLKCGVRIFSAFAANAVPVAEYTTAQIILAGKGYYQAERMYREKGFSDAHRYIEMMPGNYGEKIGIIGAGMIGKMVIASLKKYKYNILVFDPFLSQEWADKMGIKKCDLKTIFSHCLVISNHLANNEQTKGIMTYQHFNLMRPYATFINTGRGAQLLEEDLVRALQEVSTRTAVLDVTEPEPVKSGHPFYTLKNVFLTPHIAGSIGDEVGRMGQYMREEYETLAAGDNNQYEVTKEMLKTMA